MNESISNCSISDSLIDFTRNFRYLIYYILIIPYFFVGLSGHCALLIAFYRESKTEQAYKYQIFVTVNKIFAIFFLGILMVSFEVLSGRDTEGQNVGIIVGAFKKCYACQFFNARIAMPLGACLGINSLFLSLAMTFDRLNAICRPLAYRKMNHTWHQWCALITCCLLAGLVGFSTGFLYDVSSKIDPSTHQPYYELVFADSESFLYTAVGRVFDYSRSIVRITGVLLLCASSVALALAFRTQSRKVRESLPQEEQLRRLATERSLMILSICQSIFLLFHRYTLVLFEILLPILGECWGPVLGPFVDGALEVSETVDFLVVIAVNSNMRRAFFKVVPLDKVWRRLREVCMKSSTQVVAIK